MTFPAEILTDIDHSTSELVRNLSIFNDEQFNRRPADQTWSAAEVAEHLLLIETKINNELGNGYPTERAPDKKIAMMRDALEDETRKFTTPDFFLPGDTYKFRQKMVDLLLMQREILKAIIQTTNLTQTTEFKHPMLGRLTRLEWIYFNIHHTDRHCRQLHNLAREFGLVNDLN